MKKLDVFLDEFELKNKILDGEDLFNKKVFIIFKTDSIGDTLAWIPYVEEYRKKHNCKVVCATYYNNLFKNEYKEIEFVEIGGNPRNPIYPVIDNVHDTFKIWKQSHPIWADNSGTGKVIPPIQQIITDILDLEYKEIKPKVSIPNKARDIEEKYVCISIQSTAQCKYWNCKGGWNKIVKYLKSLGYKVVCIDRDKQFGVSGQFNKIPKGVIDKTGNIPLTERMVTLKYADFLISISSGLSWLSWSVGTPVIMVSSFTKPFNEFQSNNIRVYKEHSNSGFYNTHRIDPWDWNWNPIKECKTLEDWNEFEPIREDMVIDAIDRMMISQIKKVFMKFGSDSIGDTLAWIPYVEEYRKKHNCKVVCSTFWNNLFKDEYKEIEFLEIEGGRRDRIYPIVDDADAIYEINSEDHINSDEGIPPLQQISTDILDLEYKEIKPKVSIPNKERNIEEKYVCIALQSTNQAKYWNWINGWQEVVDYLNENGYRVVCIDKHNIFGSEDCGYFNEIPKRVIDKTGCTLEEAMSLLNYADFHIGISTGLTWLAWAVGTPTILISSMSKPFTEFQNNVIRLYNDNEKSGWWNNFMHTWDCWDWNWNPIKECKTLEDWHDFETITPQQVKTAVDEMIIKTIGDEITVETDIKKVYIYFGSKALGDSIGWMPYCLEYKKKFKVNEVVVSTYWNNLFEPVYPELTFVEPGVLVSNINKRHIIDFYGLNLKEKDLFDNPFPLKNYKECGVQEQATNCLGLEYKEIKPKIVIPDKTRRIKGKYVCIAIQSTCQSKYWNLKGGWNAIVKYLKKRGYKVICIDKYTQFGIKDHWNFIPKGVINKTGEFPIEDRIHDIKHAELFIGISSGLAWVAYAVGTPVVMISGMSKPWNEFNTGIQRVHNDKVCNGCWHTHEFDANNWLWCPENKNFECSKQISFNMVKDKVDNIIGNL